MAAKTQPIDLGILFALAYQEFVRELRDAHVAQGFDDLGRSDGYVFRALAQQPRTVSDLAGWLGISKQGAAQIIDDMEARGYLERRQDPSDARARLVSLSPRGEAALAAARRFHQQYERRLARRCGLDTAASLRTALEAIVGDAGRVADPRLRALYL